MATLPAERRIGLWSAIQRLFLLALLVLWLPLWVGCTAHTSPQQSGAFTDEAPRLEFLGATTLPPATHFAGAPVGGLSGLSWEPTSETWLLVSDDRAARGPARLYRMEIQGLASGSPDDIQIRGVIPLRRPDGSGFEPYSLDPEDVAILPDGTLLVTSEGNASTGIGPWIRRFSPDGLQLSQFPIPDYFAPTKHAGVRDNTGFEALGLTPDGSVAVVGTEAALKQDGPANRANAPSPARLILFDTSSGARLAQYIYPVDPVSREPAQPGDTAIRGLSDILALDANTFLTLERQYIEDFGTRVDLFLAHLDEAENVDDVRSLESLAEPPRTVQKRLLLSLNELEIPIDNLEGLAWGPRLHDGRRLLVIVSDDNFNPGHQITQFLVFAVNPLSPL